MPARTGLLDKTDIIPIILEMTDDIGGISKTVVYKGNRIDIGGHRFFSKSDRVMQWWQNILPLQGAPARDTVPRNQRRMGGPAHQGTRRLGADRPPRSKVVVDPAPHTQAGLL